jgi:hypothetical protein
MLSYLLGLLLLLMLFNPVYARHLSRTVEYCSTATQLAQQSLDAACLQRAVGFQLLIPWLHLLLLRLLQVSECALVWPGSISPMA